MPRWLRWLIYPRISWRMHKMLRRYRRAKAEIDRDAYSR